MGEKLNRRQFIGLGAAATASLVLGCSGNKTKNLNLPLLLDVAPDGQLLKAGVIGCGGRGTGAAIDFLNAGPNLTIVAVGDVFADRIESSVKRLKEEKGIEIPETNRFIGFDAYKKVLASDVNVVILATPPYFRPEHFAAAVEAKKHVFMEKPIAVDAVGIRTVLSAAKRADLLGLSVVTGTQRRHSRSYVETFKLIANGAIGEIVSANCYWNQNQLWYVTPKKNWTEMEAMLRDWVNWQWLSGDHIVEQHVHNIDVINWFVGAHPVKTVGFGARMRRVTGNQYDFFSVDFVFENGMHCHSMSRQINGCATNVSEWIVGTKGTSNCRDSIKDHKGKIVWQYEFPKNEKGESTNQDKISPYVQEHIDLVTAIRTNKPINEAENTAISNMAAIMGRVSAYTGKEVSWDEMISSDLKLGPKELAFGTVDVDKSVPVPGTV